MKLEELKAIKRRCANATRGPWHFDAQIIYSYYEGEKEHPVCRIGDELPYNRDDGMNAEFIAASRTDVPALVEEVERLQLALALKL